MEDTLPLGLRLVRDSPDPASAAALRKGKGKAVANGHVSGLQNGDFPDNTNGADSPSSDNSDSASRKPVLSEEQKKANHIQSEQKRREKIREQYDKLAELTPGMEGQGRSEGRVLEEAVKYAEVLRKEREKLIADIEMRGGIVDPEFKKY
ncbi:MAG: hypothetical protein LQ340_004615 [Diploschistes diacapsis]|nr:MAG: hypothetical protein LQ340_004615 [Diploschistes diacapsis]